MWAGVETGGTKTVCAVGSADDLLDRIQFPTGSDPQALVDACVEFFSAYDIAGLGIGSFGPCDLDPASETFGFVLNSPKPGWATADLLGMFTERLWIPAQMTTDVNAAAYAEFLHGAGVAVQSLVYMTIGTGVGAGAVIDGQLLRQSNPPEMGHMLIPLPAGIQDGTCPYHGTCFEGVAAGPSLQARYGKPAHEWDDDDPAWDEVAALVARALHSITCALTPEMIIIGGGVGSRHALQSRVPALLESSLAGYVPTPVVTPPGLGSDSGVVGALAFAQHHIQG